MAGKGTGIFQNSVRRTAVSGILCDQTLMDNGPFPCGRGPFVLF